MLALTAVINEVSEDDITPTNRDKIPGKELGSAQHVKRSSTSIRNVLDWISPVKKKNSAR